MTVQEKLAEPMLAKLTVRDFLLLADSGAFERYARTELIEGEIWVVNAVHRRHARVHALLTAELGAALKAMRSPLEFYTAPSTELSDDSMPEPDIAVAEPSEDRTLSGKVVRLAIEISDSTLKMDMGRKARLYARHGVPEYWVVDVESGAIHQMWSPSGEAYLESRIIPLGEPIVAATIASLTVETTIA
jgi:Uma2 family endonuclease